MVGLNLTGGAKITGGALQLTTGSQNQTTSAYYSTPVYIGAFTTEFDLRLSTPASSTSGEGITFVIQNAGSTALGSGGDGLGYAGIPNSAAIKFNIFNSAGQGNDSTGLYLHGATPTVPSIDLTSSGIELGSGHLIHVTVTYEGTTLTWTLKDTVNSLKVFEQVAVNLPHAIGSNTAYVGFTGAEGDGATIQNILDWTFTSP